MNPVSREKLFAYFVVNAPKEPQPWFTPVGLGGQPEIPKHPEVTRENITLLFSSDEIPPTVSEIEREKILAFREKRKAHGQWLNEQQKQVSVQWPIAYANETIKAIEAIKFF